MELFSEWVLDEAKQAGLRPKKAKHAAVAHTDIDRWLKSVDGLAKDLSALKDAKKKAQDKMDQIGQKYKPEEKPEEKKPDDKHREEKPDERKPTKPRPDADREVLPRPERREREPDEAIVKRRLSKPDRKPEPKPEREPDEVVVKRRLKSKPNPKDEDIE